jgi:hypothetical protein
MKKMLAMCLSAILALSVACSSGGSKSSSKDKTAAQVPTATEATVSHTVTFYDGETVLKTEQVDDGKMAVEYTPEKDGYAFMNWYATPSQSRLYDFSAPVTAARSIFAGFSKYQDDTRTFYIVGSGTSKLLLESNWGTHLTDDMKLTKIDGENTHTITCDILQGDQFQFAISDKWEHQRGLGYLVGETDADGVQCFTGAGGGLGEVTDKTKNIECLTDGNYTFMLHTFPADDKYNTSAAAYTEEGKEVYDYSVYDYITWTRNGEPVEQSVEVDYTYYIKGEKITNWTDMYNSSMSMTADGTKNTLTIYLEENDVFLFTSAFKSGDAILAGTEYAKFGALDEASKPLFTAQNPANEADSNIVANASGMYTFTYDKDTKSLTATVDTTKTPELRDYYLDGTFAGDWGDTMYGLSDSRNGTTFSVTDYKFIENADGLFVLENVSLPEESEFIIQTYKRGAKEAGEYGTDGYNALGTYNFMYLAANPNFTVVGGGNDNIKVVTAGTYTITLDPYSQIMTITP